MRIPDLLVIHESWTFCRSSSFPVHSPSHLRRRIYVHQLYQVIQSSNYLQRFTREHKSIQDTIPCYGNQFGWTKSKPAEKAKRTDFTEIKRSHLEPWRFTEIILIWLNFSCQRPVETFSSSGYRGTSEEPLKKTQESWVRNLESGISSQSVLFGKRWIGH